MRQRSLKIFLILLISSPALGSEFFESYSNNNLDDILLYLHEGKTLTDLEKIVASNIFFEKGLFMLYASSTLDKIAKEIDLADERGNFRILKSGYSADKEVNKICKMLNALEGKDKNWQSLIEHLYELSRLKSQVNRSNVSYSRRYYKLLAKTYIAISYHLGKEVNISFMLDEAKDIKTGGFKRKSEFAEYISSLDKKGLREEIYIWYEKGKKRPHLRQNKEIEANWRYQLNFCLLVLDKKPKIINGSDKSAIAISKKLSASRIKKLDGVFPKAYAVTAAYLRNPELITNDKFIGALDVVLNEIIDIIMPTRNSNHPLGGLKPAQLDNYALSNGDFRSYDSVLRILLDIKLMSIYLTSDSKQFDMAVRSIRTPTKWTSYTRRIQFQWLMLLHDFDRGESKGINRINNNLLKRNHDLMDLYSIIALGEILSNTYGKRN